MSIQAELRYGDMGSVANILDNQSLVFQREPVSGLACQQTLLVSVLINLCERIEKLEQEVVNLRSQLL